MLATLHCWYQYKTVQPLRKIVGQFLIKWKYHVIQKLHLWTVIPEELKLILIAVQAYIYISVLFGIPQIWKQPRYLLTDEWLNKLWYIHILEKTSAMKRNAQLIYVTIWMDVQIMMVCEKEKQIPKVVCYVILFI